MISRFSRAFVLTVLTLALASGCVAVPVSSVSSSTGTPGEPVVQTETAAPVATATSAEPPAQAAPTATPAVDATGAAPAVASATPTFAPTATPTVEAATSTAAAPASTPEAGRYRGPSAYGPTPLLEVAYDPASWEYFEDDGSGRPSQLKHRTLTGCSLWLRAGPVGSTTVASVYLAGSEWKIAQVDENIIAYVLPQDQFAWIFGLILP